MFMSVDMYIHTNIRIPKLCFLKESLGVSVLEKHSNFILELCTYNMVCGTKKIKFNFQYR